MRGNADDQAKSNVRADIKHLKLLSRSSACNFQSANVSKVRVPILHILGAGFLSLIAQTWRLTHFYISDRLMV